MNDEVYAQEVLTGTVDNGIPVVYLNIDESKGTIEEMIGSLDHSVYCYGTVSVVVPEGFRYSDMPDIPLESLDGLEMSIRGRGNSTWERSPKKPFKIKLEKKADVLGLGENKHWVLLANYFDQTLIRDRITAWLGDEIGLGFTPRGVPVDLVMTGEEFGTQYLGSYYLSENVRVDINRLEIEELKEDDTDPLTITGGYLIQNSFQVAKDSPDRFRTRRGAEWATHTPSFDTEESSGKEIIGGLGEEEQREESFSGAELADAYKNNAQMEYIQNYIQMFEDVLYEQGTAYRDLMDLESTAKYWLVQTFTLNGDAYATGSTYFYKDRDVDGKVSKIYWGPLWDFDFAWDKQLRTENLPYGHEWMKPMFYDKGEGGFVEELHKQWPVMREALIRMSEDGGIIDGYRDETRRSAEQDRKIHFPEAESSYDEDIEALKEWIRKRIAWVDENFSLVDDLVHKVDFIVDGQTYASVYRSNEEYMDGSEEFPDKDGYVFIGWTDEDGNIIDSIRYVTEDMTVTAKYLSDKEASHGADIAFSKNSDIIRHNVHIFMYQIPYTVIPENADDRRVEWSSSDESYATVDDQGMVTFNGPGTVTLTAKLKFGKTRQFTLTVLDGELPLPETVKPETDRIRLRVGEQWAFRVVTDPDPAKIEEYIYSSDDESVVTVGEYGVITAVGKGKTEVHVTAVSYKEDGEEVRKEVSASVTVTKGISVPPAVVFVCTAVLAIAAVLVTVRIVRKKRSAQKEE